MISSRRYVLSAAQCLEGPYDIAEVSLGVTDLNNEKGIEKHQRIEISQADTIVHEKWRGNVDQDSIIKEGYDIMLIRLPKKAITIDDNPDYLIRPACLPFEEIMRTGYVCTNLNTPKDHF